jgi:hypothetical protein
MQVFARSERSDEILRTNMTPATPPAPAPDADPVPGDPAPADPPEPQLEKRVHGWGVLAGREY